MDIFLTPHIFLLLGLDYFTMTHWALANTFLYSSFNTNSVHFSSVAQSRQTLCDPMNHSTPGLPVSHQLPKYTQTHVH